VQKLGCGLWQLALPLVLGLAASPPPLLLLPLPLPLPLLLLLLLLLDLVRLPALPPRLPNPQQPLGQLHCHLHQHPARSGREATGTSS
jgi:hypothetical protein